MFYFAYGSNMSRRRMEERGMTILSMRPAKLEGYKLVINKKSYKNPEIGFANVVEDKRSVVEGVIYELNPIDISKLDKYEGYPKHYVRGPLRVKVGRKKEDALIYFAKPEWVVDGELKTTDEYKNYLLEGKEFLSENYYNKLNEKIKV
jgi:gamma-glutamylcyclotransferase